jgi:hypothetical protein
MWRALAATAVRPFVRDIDLTALEPSQNRSVLLFELLAISGLILTVACIILRLLLLVTPGLDFVLPIKQLDPLIETHLIVAAVVSGLLWITSVVVLRVVADLVAKAARPGPPELSVPNFRNIAQLNKERDRQEEELFERNLNDGFLLQSFEWENVRFFKSGVYRFAPRVNVLLGRNGFGKTLLLRTLVALLQRDEKKSRQIFDATPSSMTAPSRLDPGSSGPFLTVGVLRNGNSDFIRRDSEYFIDLFGKVPVLAIPDSRFVNRSAQIVSVSATGAEPLARSGARHFLSQEPYEAVIQELFAQLCLEFVAKRPWGTPSGFDRPIFKLIEEVVSELIEDDDFAFDEIRESGRNGFEILVRSAGNRRTPVPIQYASQGTLSVLAIFGLIYSFLRSLKPGREDDVLRGSGIVLIDEVDAHLHPLWQQKILAILTSKFPNVQFIVSGHSPMIVAGCNSGEVSVLRRDPEADLFYLEPLGEDFLGADPGELYQRLFEVEKSDRLYEEYSLKAVNKKTLESDIQTLTQKERRTSQDEEKLKQLVSENSLVERAIVARDKKLDAATIEARVARLEMENKKLKLTLAEKDLEKKGRIDAGADMA